MANGKKNYFRHSFFAGNDDKIVTLIANYGKEAYFHYFRLLELCGQLSAEKMPEKFVFHRRTICAELMVTNSRLGHHLLAMQSSLLLQYVLTPEKVEILIPNFPKYLGKYETKISPNTSNKIKENKIKKKEIKEEEKTEIVISDTEHKKPSPRSSDFENARKVLGHFNAANNKNLKDVDSNYKEILARLREGYSVEEMQKVIDYAAKVWSKDDFWSKFNRPSTLFSQKFGQYLDQATNHKKSATEIFIEELETANKLGESTMYDWAKEALQAERA